MKFDIKVWKEHHQDNRNNDNNHGDHHFIRGEYKTTTKQDQHYSFHLFIYHVGMKKIGPVRYSYLDDNLEDGWLGVSL